MYKYVYNNIVLSSNIKLVVLRVRALFNSLQVSTIQKEIYTAKRARKSNYEILNHTSH